MERHLDGRSAGKDADDILIDCVDGLKKLDLDLGKSHMRSVKAFRLAHLVKSEEIEDNVRLLSGFHSLAL